MIRRLTLPGVGLLFGALLFLGCSSGSDDSATLVIAGTACTTNGAQAGSSDRCNTCTCSGGEWSCTALDCTAPCMDGATRDDGCNTCTCTDQTWSCTALFCSNQGCSDGDTRSGDDGCSACTCSGGQWACSDAPCLNQCIDGERMPAGDGCNTCSCSGGQWACTGAYCQPDCVEGDTQPAGDGCNTCSCSGGQWSCTMMDCAPCTDGEKMLASDGCNTCACTGGEWQCTAEACSACPAPVPSAPGVACQTVVVYARDPGTLNCCQYGNPCSAPAGWPQYYTMAECQGVGGCMPGDTRAVDDGCNTCSCTDAGTWVCTTRACTTCFPGETRRAADGCNTCTCDAFGSWACTETACTGPVGCGGWLGDTCTDDEYCAYVAGQLCGAADASAYCQPRPTTCATVDDPVCGCDGWEYSNSCEAARGGTGVYSSGSCAFTL
jgi:hypothetical protein